MKNKIILALMALALLQSLTVVYARQESRRLFSDLHKLHTERDALNVEWGRLLLEEGAWSQHRRVDSAARNRLGMELPAPANIVVITRRGDTR